MRKLRKRANQGKNTAHIEEYKDWIIHRSSGRHAEGSSNWALFDDDQVKLIVEELKAEGYETEVEKVPRREFGLWQTLTKIKKRLTPDYQNMTPSGRKGVVKRNLEELKNKRKRQRLSWRAPRISGRGIRISPRMPKLR